MEELSIEQMQLIILVFMFYSAVITLALFMLFIKYYRLFKMYINEFGLKGKSDNTWKSITTNN